jgi:hypothetical protein
MNKEAMLEIADVIEKAKPENFSMGSFFGERVTLSELYNYDSDGTYDDLLERGYQEDDFLNTTKRSFALEDLNQIIEEDGAIKISCNSTACIAGWVVVNQWLKNDNSFYDREYIESRSVSQVVTIAAEILGLTIEEAYNLFYCQYGSVWDVLKHKYDFNFDNDIPETWNLDNKKVAHVLRRIANGEIELTDEWIESNDEYN